MNRLIRLHKLFKDSGIKSRAISDQELVDLKMILQELADYMKWRGDKTMEASFRLEKESVRRMIFARRNG